MFHPILTSTTAQSALSFAVKAAKQRFDARSVQGGASPTGLPEPRPQLSQHQFGSNYQHSSGFPGGSSNFVDSTEAVVAQHSTAARGTSLGYGAPLAVPTPLAIKPFQTTIQQPTPRALANVMEALAWMYQLQAGYGKGSGATLDNTIPRTDQEKRVAATNPQNAFPAAQPVTKHKDILMLDAICIMVEDFGHHYVHEYLTTPYSAGWNVKLGRGVQLARRAHRSPRSSARNNRM
jgi:hypothetical protein